jgi:periplasmic protein CpxP/Spy
MEKNKLQRIIIIGLVVLNLGLMVFVFLRPMGKGPHRRHQEPKHIIIEKLHLDKEQIAAYDDLIKDHQTRIREARNEQSLLKQSLYKLLNDREINNEAKDSFLVLLGTNQQKIEQIHYSHFNDIKALCHPEQMADFIELTKELSQLFAPPMPKRHD